MRGGRSQRFANRQSALSSVASRDSYVLKAFRPAFPTSADASSEIFEEEVSSPIASADPEKALKEYRNTPEGMQYENLGIGSPINYKQMKQIKRLEQKERDEYELIKKDDKFYERYGFRPVHLKNRKRWGFIILFLVCAGIVTIFAIRLEKAEIRGNNAESQQEGSTNSPSLVIISPTTAPTKSPSLSPTTKDSFIPTSAPINLSTPPPILTSAPTKIDEFVLEVPLEIEQMRFMCSSLHILFGRELEDEERFFGCTSKSTAFICGEENEDIVENENCGIILSCACGEGKIFVGDNPCLNPFFIRNDDCVEYDLNVFS